MSRRRFQRGSVKLRGKIEKVWVGRWREDEIRPDGTLHRRRRAEVLGTLKDYPTKKLSLRALQDKLTAVNSTDYHPRPTITFKEFAKKWEEKILPQHKRSSRSAERSVLRTWLVPYFGNLQLKNLNAEMIQTFISQWTKAPKTLQNVIAVLRMTWTTARAWNYVPTNADPFFGLVLPEMVSEEQPCFTIEEMRRVIEAVNEPYRTFFWLASETGMRSGELIGLRLEDVDVVAGLVKVRQSVWRGEAQTTKTKRGVRRYVISPQLRARLAEFIKSTRREGVQLVFASETGQAWDDGNVRRKLYSILKNLKLPRAGMHAFRHGNETVMAHLQVPPKLRQQRLGHSDERMMLRYEHVVSQDEINLANKLGEMLEVVN
jgi:integrase